MRSFRIVTNWLYDSFIPLTAMVKSACNLTDPVYWKITIAIHIILLWVEFEEIDIDIELRIYTRIFV